MAKLLSKISKNHTPLIGVAIVMLVLWMGIAQLAMGLDAKTLGFTVFSISVFWAATKRYIH